MFVWLRDQIYLNAKMILPVLKTDEYKKSVFLIYLVLCIVHIKYCSIDYDYLVDILEKLGNDEIFLIRSPYLRVV